MFMPKLYRVRPSRLRCPTTAHAAEPIEQVRCRLKRVSGWMRGRSAPMESITKNRQSQDALRAMVERAYGPGQLPGGDDWVSELGHGWFNVAYRIRLRDGRRVVLKIAPPPHIEVMTY